MAEENTTNNPTDLGGLSFPPSSGTDSGASATGNDLSRSAEIVKQRKKRSDAGQPRGSRAGQPSPSVQPLSPSQFSQLYNPDLWSRALAGPGDAMAAITGRAHWEISQKERESLGVSGSIAAQCFAVTDPRWLAVSLALITVLDVYGLRIAKDFAIDKAERDIKKKAEQEKQRHGG